MRARVLFVIVWMCIAGSAAVMHAQRAGRFQWGQPAVPRDGACFYRDSEYRGEYFCTSSGESLPSVQSGMNDRISSIRLFGRASVTVFRDARFRGSSARFDSSVRNLQAEGWNDKISSLQVGRAGWAGGARPPVWGTTGAVPKTGACFYSDANYRGNRFCLPRGGSYSELPSGFNDRISSIRLMGSTVMIFKDRDYRGKSTRVDRNAPNLGSSWGDTISSIRVF